MRPSEHDPVNDNKPPQQRRDYALFFFEKGEGGRTYFRFTSLGVTVILLITIVPVILVLIYTVISTSRISNMNINANVMSTPYPTNRPVIQMPTPRPAPPKIRQQSMNVPNPLNDPVIINRSESPTPSRSPAPQSSNRSANFNHHGL